MNEFEVLPMIRAAIIILEHFHEQIPQFGRTEKQDDD
jgi:hypothetical protein